MRLEQPREHSGVREPGLLVLPTGVERHPVPGGGTRAVQLEAGDVITLVDTEGLQPIEFSFFSPDGRSDIGMLGAASAGVPNGIQRALAAGDASGARVRRALERAGFDLANADAARVFGEGSRAGDVAEFTAGCDGLLIVCAVGDAMLPHEQTPPTDVVLYVTRSRVRQYKGGEDGEPLTAPTPLADPLHDANIQPGQAHAYEVRAGQYFQILDVQGRECSDFQAFALRDLDRGLEREIDPTATRSFSGLGYPAPGLYSKYWTVDQTQLVELVADTCGRHDTFGLACTSRYYDDLGYPGHINCTDNMNRELAAWQIRPRGGWPAINFFFNTMLDDANALGMDDPWSRPGEYVLLRAVTDLLCVSTACPCDIDPANGWNPTDIQVRVYSKNEDFKRSIAFRKSAEADMEETRETGFHASFAAYTRDFTEYNGFWLANQMSNAGAIAEYWACREKAVVMDLSPLRKYEVTGPDAEALMQLCVTRNMKKLSVGQVVYTAMCYEHGGMIDDGTVFRLADTNFRWIGGCDSSGEWLREQAAKHQLDVWVRNSTNQLANIAVQGPLSRDILAEVFWTPPAQSTVEELAWFRFTIARVGDMHGVPVVVSRTGYTGELGYEVFCHPRDAAAVFEAIRKVGEPRGMLPCGLAALDMLRIEAGLIFANYEFSDQTDPFEAGIGFTVPLKSKGDPFIGREALERRKTNPQKVLVGLEIDSGTVPANGDCVRLGRAQVGEITSAMRSPILGKTIAMARVDVTHAAPGTALEVGQLDGLQKRLGCRVVRLSHFDPEKQRVRGHYTAESA
ncbi:MAG: DUF1989 domain-containing protein [Pseudomonadota bacterium]